MTSTLRIRDASGWTMFIFGALAFLLGLLGLIRPELPECIDPIIDRTLAKDADHRYATCGELGLALRNCAASLEEKRAAEATHEWLIP